MNRSAAIEMQKIVIWVIAVLVALAILAFMFSQLAPGSEGGVMNQTISRILGGP